MCLVRPCSFQWRCAELFGNVSASLRQRVRRAASTARRVESLNDGGAARASRAVRLLLGPRCHTRRSFRFFDEAGRPRGVRQRPAQASSCLASRLKFPFTCLRVRRRMARTHRVRPVRRPLWQDSGRAAAASGATRRSSLSCALTLRRNCPAARARPQLRAPSCRLRVEWTRRGPAHRPRSSLWSRARGVVRSTHRERRRRARRQQY